VCPICIKKIFIYEADKNHILRNHYDKDFGTTTKSYHRSHYGYYYYGDGMLPYHSNEVGNWYTWPSGHEV